MRRVEAGLQKTSASLNCRRRVATNIRLSDKDDKDVAELLKKPGAKE